WGAGDRGRITRGAVDALLANMYLNARVFKNEGAAAGISATSYNSCLNATVSGGVTGGKDACQAAFDEADSVIKSGVYQLADSFPENFIPDNYLSPENIFVVKFADADGLGFNFVMRTLHYNQFTPSPWNGFAALAQTYNAFDPADKRRKIFLVGPQVNLETLQPAETRDHKPLDFSITIGNVTSANEAEGARIYKWPIDKAHVQQNNGNDFAWFRLAEMYLIQAEALNEQTPGSGAALAALNTVRARTVPVAGPLRTLGSHAPSGRQPAVHPAPLRLHRRPLRESPHRHPRAERLHLPQLLQWRRDGARRLDGRRAPRDRADLESGRAAAVSQRG